ncbi:MAG: hypothetical protein M1835_001122 [Candelina submexicana]|nr:MAG: hypothetical protein M1835_001122 [Candelina submexicana]
MSYNSVQPIESSFNSKPSTVKNDPRLRRAALATDRKFKPAQDMVAFVWSKEHTMMLKRLVVQYYTKGRPCTAIYDKFNEFAGTTFPSAFLLRKIKEITERNGGSLARLLSGKGAAKAKKTSGLITGQRGAGIKD